MLITSGIIANIAVVGALYRKTPREKEANKRLDKSPEYCKKSKLPYGAHGKEQHPKCNEICTTHSAQMDKTNDLKLDICDTSRRGTFHQITNEVRSSKMISLVRNCRFMLFLVSILLRGFANYAADVHFASICVSNGLSKQDATFLLSLMGICGTVARLSHGILIDRGFITPLHLLSLALFIGGAVCVFIAIYTSFVTLVIFVTIFGTVSSVFCAIVPVAIRQILPVDQVKNGYALNMTVACTGGLLGIPFIGEYLILLSL